MKIKSEIKYVFAAVAVLALAAIMAIGLCVPKSANAAAGDVYTQNFTSAAAVNADFTAYYQLTMGTGSSRTVVGDSSDSDTNFYIEGGELIRHSLDSDVSTSYTTDSFAILTLTKRQYVNFDLSVDYKMGEGTDYWPVVAFRQQEAGKYFLETGAGVFVQKEGKVTLWGSDVDGIGGPYEKAVANYSREGWHTLRIKLDGLDLSVWLDNSSEPVFTRKLPLSAFKSGYVSLISVNNESRFRNFRITELAVKAVSDGYQQAPEPSADTPDSIDKLAERVDGINELSGHTQTSGNTEPKKSGKKGCNGYAAESMLPVAALTLSAAIVLFCTRKKRQNS